MPTIRISEETASAINELGGTFDSVDEVLQRVIREAGHAELLTEPEPTTENTPQTTDMKGSRKDWIDAWLNKLEQKAADRNIPFHRVSGRGGADFEIGDGCVGKIRTSKAWTRDDGRIWLRFDDEVAWASEKPGQKTVAVVLDIHDRSPSFTEDDHFFVLDREMLLTETSEAGNRDLQVYDEGVYESPFDQYADDWNGWLP
jgi:hypothetical protein